MPRNAPWMYGLLGADTPGGLLGAMTPQDPIAQALAQMAQQRAQVQQTTQPAPPAVRAPQGPVPSRLPLPARGPQIQAPAAARQAPAAARQAGADTFPTPSPLLSGLAAGLKQGPGSYYTGPGPAFAAALEASMNAAVTRKQAKMSVEQARAQREMYMASLASPLIPEDFRPVLAAMDPKAGQEAIGKLLEGKVLGKDQRLVTGFGQERVKAEEQAEKEQYLVAGGRLFRANPGGGVEMVADDPESDPYSRAAFGYLLGKDADQGWKGVHAKGLQEPALAIIDQLRRSGADRTNVNLPQPQRGILEVVGPELQKDRAAARGAFRALGSLTEAQRLLEEGIVAGSFSATLASVGNLFVRVGLIDPSGPLGERLARTKQYLSATAQSILHFVQETGGGLRGMDKGEREWMTQAQAGNIDDRPEAMKGILSALVKGHRLVIEDYNTRVDEAIVPLFGADPLAKTMHRFFRIDAPPAPGGVDGAIDAPPGAGGVDSTQYSILPGETADQAAKRILAEQAAKRIRSVGKP